MISEGAALRLGATIATHGAKAWLQRRKATFERDASLAELVQAELKGPLQQRKLENLVERVGNQVAEQLAPVFAERFADVPPNEVEAAVLAVVDVLEQVDLSDRALLAVDADPELLARQVRRQFPERARLLSERAEQVHELALNQACRYLVRVVRHLPSFQPAAMAEVLGRLSAQSDQLDRLLARTPTTSLYAPQGISRDQAFRVEYLRHVAQVLDRLELLGLPGDEQPALPLTVAYLSLSVSDRTRANRRARPHPVSWHDRQSTGAAEGVPVEAAIGEESRVLLRGEAGSGKTTLLNWLAVKAAQGGLGGALAEWNDCVPFVIRLRSFAEGDLPRPEQFTGHCAAVVSDLMPDGWVHRLLRSGTAMVLVDGVDEVPAGRRRAVKAWLRELLEAYPSIRVVVTARTAAADGRWLADEKFSTVTLEPMNSANISAFVERWHQAAELAGGVAERRMRGQLERPHLRELAASPLLCAMLCALNLSYRSELPRNRMDLYAKALAMLLHLRDAERGIAGLLSDTEKRVLLRDLAWRLTLANKVELPTAEALEHVTRKLPAMPDVDADPEDLFKHLLERSGVLREPVPGRIDFVHRTFLEYLAADEAVQQHHVGALIAHAHLDTWWETIVMACGHATTRQASELLTGIMDRSESEQNHARHLRLLAAACLETVKDIDPAVRVRIDTMVEEKLVPPRTLRETQSLAAIGHRVLRHLPTSLDGLSEVQAAATVRAAALTGASEALPLLARYAQDSRYKVQSELEQGWQYFDPERFAAEVLADSPLRDGSFTVQSAHLLPHVHRLSALTSLSVQLPHTSPFTDLGFLDGIPHLTDLVFFAEGAPVDLTPLGSHARLKWLQVIDAGRFTGLRALTSLPLLRLTLGNLERQRSLARVGAIKTVRQLHLAGCTANGLRSLGDMSHIKWTSLFYPSGHVRSEMIADVFSGARTLHYEGGGRDIDPAPLGRMSLIRLFLEDVSLRDLSAIGRLSGLRELLLWRVWFDADLTPLRQLDLTTLWLQRGVEYRGLAELGPDVKVRYEY